MIESVDLLRKWAARECFDIEVIEIRATAAGEDVAGRMTLEFKMLQVVVVASQIEVDPIFLKQRVPVAHKDRVIAVRPIRVDRVMSHDDKDWRLPRTLELGFEPAELFGMPRS